jgi:hypothetical protein
MSIDTGLTIAKMALEAVHPNERVKRHVDGSGYGFVQYVCSLDISIDVSDMDGEWTGKVNTAAYAKTDEHGLAQLKVSNSIGTGTGEYVPLPYTEDSEYKQAFLHALEFVDESDIDVLSL